ncbi:mannose/fructose/sorbose PTS transporter subunit IIA [Utexia brackfieldae]|uniref:mannose/fructose/sorbose PTS transporter subunit IIA n=1 Tax=Utexia brackfieldae TaxID=3074108 RepID=UPI00370D0C94
MVGIILASHGEFASGILQSGGMVFGEQENVTAVTLHPSESPDDLKMKMQAAIAIFKNQEQILFLVDLWGGTPFNQANNLCSEHQDNWVIVSGLNLPMLIEAYACRLSSTSAKEIAQQILQPAREGINSNVTYQSEAPKTLNTLRPDHISEANAVGDGHIKIVLARIDSRLLHGQVATAWTKATNPNRIIVVSDSVAHDELRKKLIKEASPPGVKANVVPISKIIEVAKDLRFGHTKALLLFENPQDVLRAVEGGLAITDVNIGSMAHSVGKVVVNKAISLNEADIAAFEQLKQKEIKFDVRKVPNDSQDNFDELLNKARTELAEKK